MIHAQVHDGNNFDIYSKNPCKHNKLFQVKYTYKFKLRIFFLFLPELNYLM